jgi:hypothetical protein
MQEQVGLAHFARCALEAAAAIKLLRDAVIWGSEMCVAAVEHHVLATLQALDDALLTVGEGVHGDGLELVRSLQDRASVLLD